MEKNNGFPTASKFVAVHWRIASWEEIAALGSMDPFAPPKHWNSVRHRWVLFEPADKNAKFGWAYSRTSIPSFPPELEEVRFCHEKHVHTPSCPLIDLFGVIQFAAEERIPVYIRDFIDLNAAKYRCDVEAKEVVEKVAGALKKAHPGTWIKPQVS